MKTTLILMLLFFCVHNTFAEQTQPQPSMIRVSGEATITVAPDIAEIDIGVVTQAANAKVAATQNAEKADRIVKTLRQMLSPPDEIKTVNYSLNPTYTYPPGGGEGKVTGYTASNTVEVHTADLNQVGKIVDAATQAGANKIESLRFSVKDETQSRIKALTLAVTRAKAKVEALATALGVRIVRIYSVEEGGPQVIPLMESRMAAKAEAAEAQTVIEPGTLDIHASVTLTAEIASR